MRRALVASFGCKTNQTEGDVLRRQLAAMGFAPVENADDFDLVVVNTCTVTMRADRKCRQFIRHIARTHPGTPIYVTGCYAGRQPAALARLEGVVEVAADKTALATIIARDQQRPLPSGADLPLADIHRSRAMLKVQDGCDAFCSYCIVPHVRPTLHSEPVDEVVCEARRLVDAGFREIVLTGIHLGRYGADRADGVGLVELVRRVAATPGLARLRLSSLEMPEVADDLIDLIAASPVVCPHLHLPLQSGDDDVLRAMNRRYAARDFLDLVARLRSRISDIAITTDVIAGFPGESDAAFENTLAVAREAGFSRMHVFPFSVRPRTAAATLPGRLPDRVITGRKKRLIALADELALAFKRRFVGKTVEVLVEIVETVGGGRLLTGLTSHYLRVRFPGDEMLRNTLVLAWIESVTAPVMSGRRVVPVSRDGRKCHKSL